MAATRTLVKFKRETKQKAELTLFTSIATWRPNCLKRIPQLNLLRENFADNELAIVGLPIDENDSEAKRS